MKPETRGFLDKAYQTLDGASALVDIDAGGAVTRAYYAVGYDFSSEEARRAIDRAHVRRGRRAPAHERWMSVTDDCAVGVRITSATLTCGGRVAHHTTASATSPAWSGVVVA